MDEDNTFLEQLGALPESDFEIMKNKLHEMVKTHFSNKFGFNADNLTEMQLMQLVVHILTSKISDLVPDTLNIIQGIDENNEVEFNLKLKKNLFEKFNINIDKNTPGDS